VTPNDARKEPISVTGAQRRWTEARRTSDNAVKAKFAESF
jgi:hypothetical protein